jgi:hypothetical protein
MSIGKISVCIPKSSSIKFKGEADSKKTEYENPVSRKTEKNLAILSASGGSAVVGAIVGGSTTFLPVNGKKIPILAGVAAALITLAITLPPAIYNRKVSAFVKQKEMDVFSRDRNLKAELTEEVDKEVQDSNVSLDKKLNDNLKLQMANRGAAVGIANITSQQ